MAETSHSGNTSRLLYDSRSNVVQVSDAMGSVAGTTVSDLPAASEHGLIPHTFVIGMGPNVNNRGNTTRFTYDGLSRQLSKYEDLRVGGVGAGAVINTISVSTIWDANGRISGRVDPTGNVTTYAYDHQNRQIRETFADGTNCRYGFNRNGTQAYKIDPRGVTKEYTHDAIGRTTDVAISNLPLGQEQTTFAAWTYDGLGRILKVEDDDTVCESTFDSLSREASDLQRIGTGTPRSSKLNSLSGEVSGKVSRAFDGVGNLKQLWYPQHHSAGTPTGAAIQRTHDAVDRLNTVSQGGSQIATFDHIGGGGRRLERAYTPSGGTHMTRTLTFDSERRFSAIDVTVGASRIVGYEYTWDRADNRRTEKRLAGAVDASTVGEFYVYDSAYRLVHADRDVAGASLPVANNVASATPPTVNPATALDYHLDTSGNRTQVNDAGTIKPFVLNIGAPTHDSVLNQYSSIAGVLRAHDTAGNVTSQGSTERFFDCDNRLVQWRSGTKDVRYRYDVQGRRVSKADVAMGPAFDQVLYFYDDWQCVEETKANGALQKTFVFGVGIDEVLKATLPDAADLDGDLNVAEAIDLYYHQNSIGSITAVTDKDGNVAESYSYKPYGAVTIRDDTGTVVSATQVEQPFMFTGRRLDFEEKSGLLYYRLRYYDPLAGRFVSRDPMGMWGDLGQRGSGQNYGGNNPVNRIDPMGDWSPGDTFAPHGYDAEGFGGGWNPGNWYLFGKPEPPANKPSASSSDASIPMEGIGGAGSTKAGTEFNAHGGGKASNPGGSKSPDSIDFEEVDYLAYQRMQESGGLLGKLMAIRALFGGLCFARSLARGFVNGIRGWVRGLRGKGAGKTKTRSSTQGNKTSHQEVDTDPSKCFLAGTLVLTSLGARPIEDIRVGDRVLTRDEDTGVVDYRNVTGTSRGHTTQVFRVVVFSQALGCQDFESTRDHPYFSVSRQAWVSADALVIGEELQASDGTTVEVVELECSDMTAATFNLEIEEFHTYFVSEDDSRPGVWVHNGVAPESLPNTPGVYVITNGDQAYVGSAGLGKGGMFDRLNSGASSHAKATKLLKMKGTTVRYVEVDLGSATSRSDRNNILRYYEQREYERMQKKKYTMLNDPKSPPQSSATKPHAQKLIKKHGVKASQRTKACK